jgi:hypothetical protein
VKSPEAAGSSAWEGVGEGVEAQRTRSHALTHDSASVSFPPQAATNWTIWTARAGKFPGFTIQ